jgi:hypothetical protein
VAATWHVVQERLIPLAPLATKSVVASGQT